MTRIVALGVCVILIAAGAAAHDPASFESRAEYLLRQKDAGVMPTSMMIAMLGDQFAETRIFAVRAAASSADPGQALLLAEYLRDRDFRVRYEVMVAAGRLGEAGKDLALRGLADPIPKVRQAAAWAACHAGAEGLEPLLAAMAEETDLGVRATALANLWRFEGDDWVAAATAAAAGDEAQLRRAAAYSLARSDAAAVRPALRRLATDSEAVIRATAIAGLKRARLTAADVAMLSRAVDDADPRVRAAACLVLAERPEPPLANNTAAKVAALWSPVEPHTAVAALRAAGSRPEIGDGDALLAVVADDDPWLAAEAMIAAVKRGLEPAAALARKWLGSDDGWRRKAVARVATMIGADTAAAAAADPDPAVRLAWIESVSDSGDDKTVALLGRLVDGDPDPAVRTAALNRLIDLDRGPTFEDAIALAERWSGDAMPDARAAALAAALAVADSDEQQERVLGRAADDPNPAVGVMLVNAARSAGLPARSHPREPRHNRRWYADLVEWMLERHWLDVVTDRGTFRVRLESLEAPISCREIYELAESGFYDGLTFHRVVPNFVVQGGDPRGDGWGGAGFMLPDEPAYRPFDSARVGIATAGPNTGSSQLFITLAPADHLVGHYTNLGEVVRGRDVLRRLQVGDRIRRIEVASGDEPPPPPPVLVGTIEWSQLEDIPGWADEFTAAAPDPAVLERLREAFGSYSIVTVLGTWCHDSRREVPRLVRVLDELDRPVFSHRMIGVDRTRRITDPALAASVPVERTVKRVATIVVLDADGVELGRVVETAQKPIEQLLVEFIAPAEGWQ